MSQSQLPFWVQNVQALGPTVAAIVIGSIAAVLTWMQWRASREKLRLDLFEKRFGVFEATQRLIWGALGRGKPNENEWMQFAEKTQSIKFLFKSDVTEYVEKIRRMCIQIEGIRDEYGQMQSGADQNRLVKNESEIRSFFHEQNRLLPKVFEKYLDFSKVL